jgi:hypothetical protein
VIVRHCGGGAIARVGAEAVAVGDRCAHWMLSIDASRHDPADETSVAYTRALGDAAVPYRDGKS